MVGMVHKLTHGLDKAQVVEVNNLVQDHSNLDRLDQVEACQIFSNLNNKEWKDLLERMVGMAHKLTHGLVKLQVVEVVTNTKQFLAQLILIMRNIKENIQMAF